jgi:hypothetical protein
MNEVQINTMCCFCIRNRQTRLNFIQFVTNKPTVNMHISYYSQCMGNNNISMV